MAKGYRSASTGNRASGSSARNGGGTSSARRAANTRMWSQPATPRQIATLQAYGNHDGKYYSKGRAGQTIGQSMRSAGNAGALIADVARAIVGTRRPIDASRPSGLSLSSSPAPERADPHEQPAATTGLDLDRHIVVPQEGAPMSQLVTVNSGSVPSITSVVEMSGSPSANVVPFEFIAGLEKKHLAAVAQNVGRSVPAQVRAIEKGWARAKVSVAAKFARAHLELVAILQGAPVGTVASPEAAAREILWNSCAADLEQQLLEGVHQARGTTKPSQVLDEWLNQVDHRIELAKIYAAGQVDVARIQAAVPPAPTRGYEPCWGEVTGVKPFGVFVRLQSGESGLLHKSELAALNGGRPVEDAAALVNVGQWLHVRVTGKNDEGKLNFALANER